MINNFICPKMKYIKNEVSFMYLFFENGDFVEIKGAEIMNFSVNLYDKLIKSHKGYNPVIESGYFKFKISNKTAFNKTDYFLYNEEEFKKDRKLYIENRCINESRIVELWLFDSYNWHKVLHCEAVARKEDEFLWFEFLPQRMGKCESEKHNIKIKKLIKEDIHSIDLDFENCEGFVVYNSEIKEINITFNEELVWGSSDFYREVIGGYIKIKLDKTFTSRENTLFEDKKNLKAFDFEKRLCGKSGEDIHDICHLYINYYHAGYSSIQYKECIEIKDINLNEEMQKENDTMEFNEYDWDDFYEGGYCKKCQDGCIIIAFGKNAKNTIEKLINTKKI